MRRINLLPWRAELRKQRRNQFVVGLGGALVAAAIVLGIANLTFSRIISHQQSRNALIKEEIATLDQRIKEIIDLEAKRDAMIARMEIIEQLQRSRPEIVHVFDEIARTVPEGVYLSSVRQQGRRLEIQGMAESNTRVSSFMRAIDASDWLAQPDLEVVEVKTPRAVRGKTAAPGTLGGRESQFTVFANQESPKPDDMEEAE